MLVLQHFEDSGIIAWLLCWQLCVWPIRSRDRGCGAQVLTAAEEGLRRMGMTGAERNAVLDAFHYMEGRASANGLCARGPGVSTPSGEPSTSYDSKPLTR